VKNLQIFFVFIIGIILISGCISEEKADTESKSFQINNDINQTPFIKETIESTADDSGVTPAGVKNSINTNNQIGLDLYSELKDKEKNLFFSPYSISAALAMTYEGARGQTAKEMQSVLHFPENDSIRRSSFAEFHTKINNSDAKYELLTANALWIQKDYPLLNNYTEVIKKYYFANAENVDFANAPEDSRNKINNWVEDKTNNKIEDLFPQSSLKKS
jgi:serpin B